MVDNWEALQQLAKNNELKFNPAVLKEMLTKIGEVIGVVKAVKSGLNEVNALKPFTPLESSASLADRFSDQAVGLGTTLDNQLTNLDHMIDTFIAAARAYKDSEDHGKIDFDKIKSEVNTAPAKLDEKLRAGRDVTELGLPPLLYPDPKGDSLPPALQNNKVGFEPAKIPGEEATRVSYEKYEAVWNAFDGGAPWSTAQNAGHQWSYLGGYLKESFDSLARVLVQRESDWHSPGAKNARDATAGYSGQVKTLGEQMNRTGENMVFVARWMAAFGYEMGQWDTPVPKDNETQAEYDERFKDVKYKQYVTAMNQAYLPGLTQTDGAIPVLPNPGSPVNEPGQPGGPPGGPPGAQPGAKPGPPGGTPGAVNTAALKQQQDAYNKAQEQLRQQAKADQQKAIEQQKADERRQAEYVKQQQDAQKRADDAAKAQQAQQAAQQAGQQAAQAGQQGLDKAVQAAQQAMQQGIADKAKEFAQTFPAGLDSALAAANKGLGSGPGPGKGAGPGPGTGSPLSRDALQAAKLFPRAMTADGAAIARAGLAATAGQPGTPGGMGPAGQGAGQGGQKEHKRADYLDSVEHLEEALGDAPVVAKPVVEK